MLSSPLCKNTFIKYKLFAFMGIFLLAASLCFTPYTAFAVTSSVKTAATETHYRNPATGKIEDSGGEANEALGSSMCRGAVFEQALVETDTDGSVYLTLRLKQADQISNLTVESDPKKDNSFGEAVAATVVQQNTAENTADWRVKIASADASLRCKMHVDAMGRDVLYFVTLTNLQDGNPAGFLAQITPGQGSDNTDSSQSDKQPSSEETTPADPASDKSDEATAGDINEYDAEGRETTGSKSNQPLDLNYPLVALIAVVAVALIGGGIYAFVIRPKRAKQNEALKEAQGSLNSEAPAQTDADSKK